MNMSAWKQHLAMFVRLKLLLAGGHARGILYIRKP